MTEIATIPTAGWFDASHATHWEGQHDETLWRTGNGKWVLDTPTGCRITTPTAAAAWLRSHGHTKTTPLRTVRIPDELWTKFGQWCTQHGLSRSEALRRMITNTLGDHNA